MAPRRADPFAPVAAIGRTLPDVEETTTWGKPTLKVGGSMFVCIASHKSAEPDTLVVMMDFADRDLLIEEDMVARAPDRSHFVGSAITMKQAYANLVGPAALSQTDATKLTRDNPMRAIGLS